MNGAKGRDGQDKPDGIRARLGRHYNEWGRLRQFISTQSTDIAQGWHGLAAENCREACHTAPPWATGRVTLGTRCPAN